MPPNAPGILGPIWLPGMVPVGPWPNPPGVPGTRPVTGAPVWGGLVLIGWLGPRPICGLLKLRGAVVIGGIGRAKDVGGGLKLLGLIAGPRKLPILGPRNEPMLGPIIPPWNPPMPPP